MDCEQNSGTGAAPCEPARQAVDPSFTNAAAVAAFWAGDAETIDAQAAYDAIHAQVQAVRNGALASVEATLVAQAIALNGVFVDLARRGQASLGKLGQGAERLLRLAFKAQNQCRATLYTLANVASRPSKTQERPHQITRIERVIIRPGDRPGPTWPNEAP